MNIVFFGSSDFSIQSLIALHDSHYDVNAVVTQPDKKKGRGLKMSSPPCAVFARENSLPLYQPQDVTSAESVEFLRALDADLFVVVSYGRVLSQEILDIPRLGSINLHTSLLPEYRGAAPIEWAIINGETTTGVTIFKLEQKLDSGKILLQKEMKIGKEEDAVSLTQRMSHTGSELLIEAIGLIKEGKAEFTEQDEGKASAAPKIRSEHKLIDWGKPVIDIYDLVRGLTTEGGAHTFVGSKRLKVWKSEVVSVELTGAQPGTILDITHQRCVEVAAVDGVISLTEVQIEGGKRMNAYDFTLGHDVSVGAVLG